MARKLTIIDQLRDALAKRLETETQLEIAKATKISQPRLSRFLSGDKGLSLESAAKLAQYLRLQLR
jgi:transcriptional regulator with XRE-family HTH domain